MKNLSADRFFFSELTFSLPYYKNHSFAKDGFNYRTAYFEDADGQYYEVTISVGQKGEIKTIYNVGKMIKQKEKLSLVAQRPGGKAASENFSNINISKDSSDVNNNMRKDREKDNKKWEKEQKPREGAKEKHSLTANNNIWQYKNAVSAY